MPTALNNPRPISSLLLTFFLLLSIMCPQGANAESTTSVSPPTTSIMGATKKTIYLIRHAESEENRRIAALSRTFQSLKKFSFPKTSDMSTSTELLNVSAQVDSNVSEIGANQIAHMGEKLRKEKFVVSSGIDLVVHSPLLRARQTSEGMLGCMAASSSDDTAEEKKADTVSKVIETALVLEKTPAEWIPMYYSGFLKRISDFESWLGKQPEEPIAIVGHSQFFKAMLGLDYKFGNCEVWKVDFDVTSSQKSEIKETLASSTTTDDNSEDNNPSSENAPPSASSSSCWSNLEKLHACEIESSPKTV